MISECLFYVLIKIMDTCINWRRIENFSAFTILMSEQFQTYGPKPHVKCLLKRCLSNRLREMFEHFMVSIIISNNEIHTRIWQSKKCVQFKLECVNYSFIIYLIKRVWKFIEIFELSAAIIIDFKKNCSNIHVTEGSLETTSNGWLFA